MFLRHVNIFWIINCQWDYWELTMREGHEVLAQDKGKKSRREIGRGNSRSVKIKQQASFKGSNLRTVGKLSCQLSEVNIKYFWQYIQSVTMVWIENLFHLRTRWSCLKLKKSKIILTWTQTFNLRTRTIADVSLTQGFIGSLSLKCYRSWQICFISFSSMLSFSGLSEFMTPYMLLVSKILYPFVYMCASGLR